MNWIKERVGLQEPVYGPSALHSVTQQSGTYTELKKEDLRWDIPTSTCVETQTFYINTDSGHYMIAQVIYSTVGSLRPTVQFSSKLFYPDNAKPFIWATDALSNWSFDEQKYSLRADKCKLTLSEDGDSLTVKSSTSSNAVINATWRRTAPGFQAGKNGTTLYGTDPKQPWGSMRHRFWPRCEVEGSMMTKAGAVDLKGRGVFIHAIQGMRPNLAAASWNFLNFQSPSYSAIMMEFTTPPSYGSTKVTLGGIAVDGKIITAGGATPVEHTSTKTDPETGWPQPQSAKFVWRGKEDKDNIYADVSGSLGEKVDRLDILGEVPGFVKSIAQAAGTKPFIYQFLNKMPLDIQVGENKNQEQGFGFVEATYITGDWKS